MDMRNVVLNVAQSGFMEIPDAVTPSLAGALQFAKDLSSLRAVYNTGPGLKTWNTVFARTPIDGWRLAISRSGDARYNEAIEGARWKLRTVAIMKGRYEDCDAMRMLVHYIVSRKNIHPTIQLGMIDDATLYCQLVYGLMGVIPEDSTTKHIMDRWQVWQMGFGLAAATIGHLFCYGLVSDHQQWDSHKIPGKCCCP